MVGETSYAWYLVLQYVGPSLKQLYNLCDKKYSIKTIILISKQLLKRLEILHKHGWIHRDIKPANFAVKGGHGEDFDEIYMLDFGCAIRYRDKLTAKHLKWIPTERIVGTPRYSSLNNHYGMTQGRRDDLESLGYTMLYWIKGRLPWQGLNSTPKRKWSDVKDVKRKVTLETLCRDVPAPFYHYMCYVFNLDFEADPDYKYLQGLLTKLYKKMRYENDASFDWSRNEHFLSHPCFQDVDEADVLESKKTQDIEMQEAELERQES